MTVDRVSFDGWPIHPDYQHVQKPAVKEEKKDNPDKTGDKDDKL